MIILVVVVLCWCCKPALALVLPGFGERLNEWNKSVGVPLLMASGTLYGLPLTTGVPELWVNTPSSPLIQTGTAEAETFPHTASETADPAIAATAYRPRKRRAFVRFLRIFCLPAITDIVQRRARTPVDLPTHHTRSANRIFIYTTL
jgi:hypothetical protein